MRKELRALRRNIPPEIRHEAAERLLASVSSSHFFKNASSLAFYAPFDGEIDPMPLLQVSLTLRQACYLPVIAGQSLVFRAWAPSALPNQYGIAEPPPDSPAISPDQLSVIFVPLVGFDKNCNRLGMGQGFYDRLLAPLMHRATRPLFVGLAFAAQQLEAIETREWDVPMDIVATEAGWFERGPNC